MTSNLFNCSHCEYFTDKKYNLYRHMVTKHINKNDSILENVFQNTVILNKCHLCDKILSSKKI